jgi:hypothetical protein
MLIPTIVMGSIAIILIYMRIPLIPPPLVGA